MMDLPFKLFPPALLAGLAIYGAVIVLWLQPLVEQRMADKTLIPACEQKIMHLEASAPNPEQDKQAELRAMMDIVRATGLDQLPFAREAMAIANHQLQRLGEGSPRLSHVERTGMCGCAADLALEEARWPMALHVASLRTHTGNAVRSLDHTIITHAASGRCGALPWKQEQN